MESIEIYRKIIEELKQEFYLKNEKDIDEWTNGFLNKWYHGYNNRCEYELNNYIDNNLIKHIESYYDKNEVSDEFKIEMLSFLTTTKYKYKLHDYNSRLLPKRVDDFKYIEDLILNNNLRILGFVINDIDNSQEIYTKMKDYLYYQMLNAWKLEMILKGINSCDDININIYNSVFDDFCNRDELYHEINNFLHHQAKIITSTNLDSITRNYETFGKTYVSGTKKYDKIETVMKLIEDGSLEYIKEDINSFNEKDQLVKPRIKIKKV